MRLLVSSALVLVFSVAGVAQSQPRPPPSPAKQDANATRPEEEFDPILPRQVAEKLLAIDEVSAKSTGLSRLANLIWKHDQDYARALFEKALAITTPQESDGRLRAYRRNVIRAIASKDPEWARRLIDAESSQETKYRTAANINTALGLIEENPGLAVEFAQRGLQSSELNASYLQFLLNLRKTDQPRADQMFLQVLSFLGQQQQPDIKSLHLVGIYLFSREDMLNSDSLAITLVDHILVPNITAQRPNVSTALVRAYLRTASSLLLRAATDTAQHQLTYTLGRLLVPKARMAAPELVPQLEAAMAAVSSGVPPTLTNESAYKYIDMTPLTPSESLANAERKPNQDARDIAYLDIAAAAWRRSDFATARKAASLIDNPDANRALAQLIDFGEAAALLKTDASQITTIEKVAYKLPPGLERAILLLTISQHRVKSGNAALAEEAIDAALKAAAAVNDVRRPYLTLIAASHLAQLRSLSAATVTSSTIKDLNSFSNVSVSSVEWSRTVQAGALEAIFSLEISGLDLNLDKALRAIFLSDLEIGFARAQEIKNEGLRSRALVEFVAAYLAKLEKQKSFRKV